ncbi:MAG: hypothetical protein ACLUD4_09020 [Thomasclavelia spiroformis]
MIIIRIVGGVTISGGEAFVQFDALMELLKTLKHDVHVAIETTGNYSNERIKGHCRILICGS